MSSGIYVALSAQMTLERRLDTVAHNIANINTAGFRAEEVKFETVLSRAGAEDVAFPSRGSTTISRQSGPVNYTGNPLDVAVDGEAWLSIATPGGTVYTRDGRLTMTSEGELRTMAGYPILDPGGTPILLDPAGGDISIGRDGMITQGNIQVGALGLFLLPETARLSRFENSGVVSDGAATPVEDLTANGIKQGYVEGSNVNPLMEMTKLIMVSRAFESAASAIQQRETSLEGAIRDLGPT